MYAIPAHIAHRVVQEMVDEAVEYLKRTQGMLTGGKSKL